MKKLKAFTMAEAVLVMTILGIIATIMITTMKPAQFKEKGYQVLAKTIYGDIDTAITQILVDKSPYNKMSNIYTYDSTSTTFNMNTGTTTNGTNFVNLLKMYMATARGDVPKVCSGKADTTPKGPGTGNAGYHASMLLKNGACIAVNSGSTSYANTQIPGEVSATSATGTYGMIFLDTNGNEEPNTIGKDQWYIPLVETGVIGG